MAAVRRPHESRPTDSAVNAGGVSGGVRIFYREKGASTWVSLASDDTSSGAGDPFSCNAMGDLTNSLGTTVYQFIAQTYRSGTFTGAITPRDLAVGWAP